MVTANPKSTTDSHTKKEEQSKHNLNDGHHIATAAAAKSLQ